MTEHLCTATIVALVWLETEMGIGVNGIVAFFLKLEIGRASCRERV